MSYFLLLLFSFLQRTNAEPVEPLLSAANGNLTLLHDTFVTRFVSSPTYRGTTDILWTCILTIFSCIYTCIHPHVPRPGRSIRRRVLHKLKWALSALIAPEMAVCAALQQFLAARNLARNLNDMVGPEHPSSDLEANPMQVGSGKNVKENGKQQKFSLSYGFFVVMGGVSVSTGQLHPTRSSMTLTCAGVELLAKKGHFINIPEDEIADRGKANPLGKALVCAQVIWMVLQCSARAANGYPLALIEIHTMVHVFCAILIYLLWWKKPLDVTVPFTANSSDFEEILALMLMCTRSPDKTDGEMDNLILWRPPLLEENDDLVETDGVSNQEPVRPTDDREPQKREPKRLRRNTSIVLEPGERLSCGFQWSISNEYPITLTAKDCKRWLLCSNAICKYQVFKVRYRGYGELFYPFPGNKMHSVVTTDWDCVYTNRTVEDRGVEDSISEAFLDGILADFRNPAKLLGLRAQALERLTVLIVLLFPASYGGVHLAARNFPFPTSAESMLWQIACIIIMGFIPCLVAIFTLADYLKGHITSILQKTERFLGKDSDVIQDLMLDSFILLSIGLPTLLFTLSRVYLVVEAFISLRRVPLGVFMTVTWLQSIPHI